MWEGMAHPDTGAPWWGETELTPGALRQWRIGPYRLWVRATALEWRLWSHSIRDATATELVLDADAGDDAIPQDATLTRVGLASEHPVLALQPRLADRDVVVRPDIPIVVPGGARLELYVTTPVWVFARAGDGGPVLLEEPSHRLSDTWFGPNTLEGELAYAIRTSARLELEAMPHRPNRAITKVAIVNGARDPLPLQKLKVPVTGLAVYADASGLWTDHVTLERKQGEDLAEASVGAGPGVAGVTGERIAEPRVPGTTRFSLNAFGRLLGV